MIDAPRPPNVGPLERSKRDEQKGELSNDGAGALVEDELDALRFLLYY